MTTSWQHARLETLAWLEGGDLARQAYRAGVIAHAEELARLRARAEFLGTAMHSADSAGQRPEAALPWGGETPPHPKGSKVLRIQHKALGWSAKLPQRFKGYTRPLYEALRTAHTAGSDRPTAHEVLALWRERKPYELCSVGPDGFHYYADDAGTTRSADLHALSNAINRMAPRVKSR